METDLRALSFLQPWLWAILEGHKGFHLDGVFYAIENRKQPPPYAMIGRRFALHASRGWDDEGFAFIDDHLGQFRGSEAACVHEDPKERGTILGTARLLGAVNLATKQPSKTARGLSPALVAEIGKSPWAFGPWVWLLADVRRLVEPIPARGMLGFWRVPAELHPEIREEAAPCR